jgi:hypothetical protein
VGGVTKADLKYFENQIKTHRRNLLRVAKIPAEAQLKKQIVARKLVWTSLAAHTCAVLRAAVKRGAYLSPDQIRAGALDSKKWLVLTETITVQWKPKHSGGYRLITKDGVFRTAQRLVLRDMLQVVGIDNNFDYSRFGKGEKKLLTDICKLIEKEEFDWWWTTDVKSCFASLKAKHFDWLPLKGHEVRNFVFNPKCVKVKVLMPKKLDQLIQWLKQRYPTFPMSNTDDVVLFTTQLTRQGGLPEGAVHAPLLARGFLGRELRAHIGGKEGIIGFSFVDDLIIGTRLENDAQAAKEGLRERFEKHPAGSLVLHKSVPLDAWSRKVCVLGYFIEPGNGLNGTTHVKPGTKRCDRFKARLAGELSAASADEDLYEVAERYRRRWYNAQQAWTKIPIHSDMVSENITASYVDDFRYGNPVGGNHPSFFLTAASKQVGYESGLSP